MSELSEDSKFQISIKTLITIAVAIATFVGFYYSLYNEIQEAKELPKPGKGVYIVDASDPNAKETWPASRSEYNMKDQLARQTLIQLQKELVDIKQRIKKVEETITVFEIKNRRGR